MDARGKLVEQWQAKLAESRRVAGNASPRLSWLNKMRERLYRFLVSCYGRGDWNAPPAKPHEANAVALLFDTTGAERGKSPKSAERIRAALKKMHAADDPPPAKPAPAQPPAPQWVVVYSTYSRYKLQRWARWMERAGIPARYSTRGAQSRLETLPEFYDAALQYIEDNQQALTIARQNRLGVIEPQRITGATVGSFPGMCAGYVIGFLIINHTPFTTAHPEVYVMCWTAVGWIIGAIWGALCAYPAACLIQSGAPCEEDNSFRSLLFDARRYSAVRLVELLRRHGIEARYSLDGTRSVIKVEQHRVADAGLILHKHLSDPELLRAAPPRPPWLKTRTLVSFGAVVALLLGGGLLAGSTSQYLFGGISLTTAVVLNGISMIVCLVMCVILMWELQRTTIQ